MILLHLDALDVARLNEATFQPLPEIPAILVKSMPWHTSSVCVSLYWQLHQQDVTAWTQELDLRPAVDENF